VPFQDLHRRGLACPVRPEQGEDLTPADIQIYPVEGDHFAVPLAEPADPDRAAAANPQWGR
jgi:hypothetical protein